MNKTSKRLGVAAIVAGSLMSFMPAQAAGPYTLAVGALPSLTATRLAFLRTCTMNSEATALNGTDARIIEVSALVNHTYAVRSTAKAAGGALTAVMFSGTCAPVVGPGNPDQLAANGTTNFRIPAGAKWLVVEGYGVAGVEFSLNLVA